MGKPKDGGVTATWDANEVFIFCELCIKEVELGIRLTTHFNKDGWNNLVTNFRARTGKQYDRGQMKNKWDMLKKEWKLWKDLKGKQTGLGWNPAMRTIDAPDEWWEERIKIMPAAKKFRHAGISPELEEKLDMMFSDVAATGEHGWAPSLGKRHPSTGDDRLIDDDDDDDEVDPITPPMHASDFGSCSRPTFRYDEECSDTMRKRLNRGKAKVGRQKNAMRMNIGSLVDETRFVGMAIREANNPPPLQSYTISDVVKELNKHPEIREDPRLFDFATVFMMQQCNREMFLCLEENQRVWWLKNRYQCFNHQFAP